MGRAAGQAGGLPRKDSDGCWWEPQGTLGNIPKPFCLFCLEATGASRGGGSAPTKHSAAPRTGVLDSVSALMRRGALRRDMLGRAGRQGGHPSALSGARVREAALGWPPPGPDAAARESLHRSCGPQSPAAPGACPKKRDGAPFACLAPPSPGHLLEGPDRKLQAAPWACGQRAGGREGLRSTAAFPAFLRAGR